MKPIEIRICGHEEQVNQLTGYDCGICGTVQPGLPKTLMGGQGGGWGSTETVEINERNA